MRAQAAPLLAPELRERCEGATNTVLRHALALLEQPERLAGAARDRNLAALSSLLRHAHALLCAVMPPHRAARMVVVVQRALILAMLSATTFNLQLAGVRETNAMLEAAQPPPPRRALGPLLADDLDDALSVPPGFAPPLDAEAASAAAEAASAAAAWLEAQGVLARTLRSHLHLKQYVEQVERIMRFLLRNGGLRDEHLEHVWAATEQPDTFEETKANLFALLAALAADFSAAQLDALFAHLDAARARSAADTVRALGLVTALARGDAAQGALAERLTELAWAHTLAPDAPPEALRALLEVVQLYAASAPGCKATLVSRCLSNIRAGAGVLQSVRMLRCLLGPPPAAAAAVADTGDAAADAAAHAAAAAAAHAAALAQRDAARALNDQHGVLDLLLGELEQYMASARAAVAASAGAAPPPGDGRAPHAECLSERLSFLLLFASTAVLELGEAQAGRIWACCVDGAALPSDRDVAAEWLARAAALLAPAAARHVLAALGALPPAALSRPLLSCVATFVALVGSLAGHLRRADDASLALGARGAALARGAAALHVPAARSLSFDGLPLVWSAALEAPAPVSAAAVSWLAYLYAMLAGDSPADTQALREAMLAEATSRLRAATAALAAPAAGAAGAPRRATRAITLLHNILALDTAHHAARHAAGLAPPAHMATYRGRTVEVILQFTVKAPSTRLTVHLPAHAYASELRRHAAAHLGGAVPAGRLRLFVGGKELSAAAPEHAQIACQSFECSVINVVAQTVVALPAAGSPAGGADSDPDTPTITMDADGPADAGLAAAAAATVMGTPVTAAAPAPAPAPAPAALSAEDAVPSARQLLAAQPGLYDTLFALADAGPPTLCALAQGVLGALPTRAADRAALAALLRAGGAGADDAAVDAAAATADARARLAAALRAPPAARAYGLQILDGLLLPVNGFVDDEAADAAQAAFLALGGPELVLAALQPATLPPAAGAVPLRALFLSGLALLRLPRAAGGDAAAAGGTSGAAAAAAAPLLPPPRDPSEEVDSAADRFAVDTVAALLWLLPRTALGRLGASPEGAAAAAAAAPDAPDAADGSESDGAAAVRGLGALAAAAQGDVGAGGALDANDIFLAQQGLLLLTHALGQRPGGVSRLLARPEAAGALTDLLLRCPSPLLRERAAAMCVELVGRDAAAAAPPPPPSPARRGASGSGPAAMSGSGGSGGAGGAAAAAPGGGALSGAAAAADAAAAAAAAATARHALLDVLLAARPLADDAPTTCSNFFELTASLLGGCAATGGDGAALDGVLAEEVRWLAGAEHCADPADGRQEGHLALALALVRCLGRRGVTTPSGTSLMDLLLLRYLFPELRLLLHPAGGGGGGGVGAGAGAEDSLEEDAAALSAVAGTPRTRAAAFALLAELATHDAAALAALTRALSALHHAAGPGGERPATLFGGALWERLPQYAPREPGGFVGLSNGGATCYMNSVFQQLFMQPAIRRGVLGAADAGGGDPSESVLCQLQATFGALHASRLDHHRPEAFWRAFKDYDGQPVNVREHQDAFEFLTRLQEQVDAAMKPPAPPPAPPAEAPGAAADGAAPAAAPPPPQGALEGVLGGVLVNQILCRACPSHRSEKDESFTLLPVDIRKKSGLLESLASYVQGELLEGDNQWVCEACGRKVDATKRQTVKTLPHTLCIQLKRFEYDYETEQRLKVKDRFEFPQHLDMRPFTREGVDDVAAAATADGTPGASGAASGAAAAAAAPVPSAEDAAKYAYTLMGVVVHSGSAFAGHYYSYIRERVPAPGGGVAAGAWHVFDDTRVEPYDAASLERDTFGGKYTSEVYEPSLKRYVPIEYDRPNSAYMLFYERLGAPGSGGDTPARAAADGDAMETDGGGAAAPAPVRLPPRVAEEVRNTNVQCVYESHLLSRDYFTFVRNLVDAHAESSSRKRRREAGALAAGALAGTAAPPPPPPPAVPAAPPPEQLCAELAAEFLMEVYSHASTTLREESGRWLATLTALLESSRPACAWFLGWLASPERVVPLRAVLTRCPGADVRELWVRAAAAALRAAVAHDERAGEYDTLADFAAQDDELEPEEGAPPPPPPPPPEAGNLPALVHALVRQVTDLLRALVSGRLKAETSALAPLQLLSEYARLGATQRAHLVLCGAATAAMHFALSRLPTAPQARVDGGLCVAQATHALLGLLLRGAGGLNFHPVPRSGPAMAAAAAPNAYALPGGTGFCPPLASQLHADVYLPYAEKYMTLLVEAAAGTAEARDLLCYLCWGAQAPTRFALRALLSELHSLPDNDAAALSGNIEAVQALLSMQDALAPLRAAYFVAGTRSSADNAQPLLGLTDLIASAHMHKRWTLLRWATQFADGAPAGAHLRARLAETARGPWLDVVDALHDEIVRTNNQGTAAEVERLQAQVFPILQRARDLVQL